MKMYVTGMKENFALSINKIKEEHTMYRLKVKVSSRRWKIGKVFYETLQDALRRRDELKAMGIISKVVTDIDEDVMIY